MQAKTKVHFCQMKCCIDDEFGNFSPWPTLEIFQSDRPATRRNCVYVSGESSSFFHVKNFLYSLQRQFRRARAIIYFSSKREISLGSRLSTKLPNISKRGKEELIKKKQARFGSDKGEASRYLLEKSDDSR